MEQLPPICSPDEDRTKLTSNKPTKKKNKVRLGLNNLNFT